MVHGSSDVQTLCHKYLVQLKMRLKLKEKEKERFVEENKGMY